MKKVLIFGASGLIGSALMEFLKTDYRVKGVSRTKKNSDFLKYDYENLEDNQIEEFEGFDQWIILSGKSIACGFWTKKRKALLIENRKKINESILNLILKLKNRPQKIFVASGIGYYGAQGEEIVDEKTKKGEGFLSDLSEEIESIWRNSISETVVFLRFAPVLTDRGGLMAPLIKLWKWGIVPIFGSGSQYFPFVYLQTLLKMVVFLIENQIDSTPINLVEDQRLTQEQLFYSLAKKQVAHPLLLRIPSFLLKWTLQEQAKELLCIDRKVLPGILKKMGFWSY